MKYRAPSFKKLQDKTINLQQTFNQHSKRFIPPVYNALREIIGSLEKNYRNAVAQKKGWFYNSKPDPIRLEQINCIVQSKNSLPENPEPHLKEQSEFILLGALLYRLSRIDKSYGSSIYIMWGDASECSALDCVITKQLGINSNNLLDDLTLATCCRAYFTYLQLQGVSENYVYIKNDKEFFPKLLKIIESAEKNSQSMKADLQKIKFIESVAQLISKYNPCIDETLNRLIPLLEAELKIKPEIPVSEVLNHINQLAENNSIKKLIEEFLKEKDVNNVADFLGAVNDHRKINNQYFLLGAYVFLLEGEPTLELKTSLEQAIDSQLDYRINDEEKELALTAFHNLLGCTQGEDFYMPTWDNNFNVLTSKVLECLTNVRRRIERSKEVEITNDSPSCVI